MLGLHQLTSEQYIALRWQLLRQLEAVEYLPYVDTARIPQSTIGVGFNIEGNDVLRRRVFDTLFLDVDVDRQYIDRLTTILAAATNTADLRTAMNAIMQERYDADKKLPKDEQRGITQTTFQLPADLELVREIFEISVEDFETNVDKWLGSNDKMENTLERLALLSLSYNAVLPGSDNLKAAIQNGDRARAWYEIRYASNRNQDNGLAKRRYIESELFGLYPSASQFLSPNGAQHFEGLAQQLIAFFEADAYPANSHANNLLHMIAYEKQYGHMVSAAQADVNAIEGLSLTVQSWGTVFKPIASHLINHYTKNESVKFDGTNYSFDGDVNLGLDKGGVIQALGSAATANDKDDLFFKAVA